MIFAFSLSPSPRLLSILFPLTVLLATGCASADRVESHPDWPTEQGAWNLYESEGQLVYATGGRAAEQVGQFVREVTADYREITGEDPPPIVPVAFDSGDDPPIESFETRWVELFLGTKSFLDAMRSADAGVSNASVIASIPPVPEGAVFDPEDPDHFRLADLKKKGIPPSTIVALSPVFCPPEMIGLTLAENAPATYVPLLPSSGQRSDALSVMLEAGMREQGLSWWKRRLVAPIVALMRGSLEAKMEDMVRFAYFEVQLLAREPRFSPEERNQYLGEYAVKIGLREPPDFSAARAAAEELEAAGALEGESEESGALMQER